MGGHEDSNSESADPGCAAEGLRRWPKVATDYHGALLRLATMRAAKRQYLIFGYVELFSARHPAADVFRGWG
jgi:hypothetical protein